jgi:hypothetical protein
VGIHNHNLHTQVTQLLLLLFHMRPDIVQQDLWPDARRCQKAKAAASAVSAAIK